MISRIDSRGSRIEMESEANFPLAPVAKSSRRVTGNYGNYRFAPDRLNSTFTRRREGRCWRRERPESALAAHPGASACIRCITIRQSNEQTQFRGNFQYPTTEMTVDTEKGFVPRICADSRGSENAFIIIALSAAPKISTSCLRAPGLLECDQHASGHHPFYPLRP